MVRTDVSGVSITANSSLRLSHYRMAGNFGKKIFWRIAESMTFGRIYCGS